MLLPVAGLITAGAVWMLSGGEQGSHLDWRYGERRLTNKNLNLVTRALAAAALQALRRVPLPHAAGQIGPGSPADPASVIEGQAPRPS